MPVHPSVSYEDFFHDFNGPMEIENLWFRPEDISDEWHQRVVKGKDGDYITPIEKGKDWLFELTCQHQPRAGAMIMEGGPLFVRNRRYGDSFLPGVMAVEVNGKLIRFFRVFAGSNPSDENYQSYETGPGGYERSLPDGLGEAYYTRFGGMKPDPRKQCWHLRLGTATGSEPLGPFELLSRQLSRCEKEISVLV